MKSRKIPYIDATVYRCSDVHVQTYMQLHLYVYTHMKKVTVLVAQLLCNPMDCVPPGSSVHGILQARILQWVAIPFSRGIFPTEGSNPGLLHCRRICYPLSHQGSPYTLWVYVHIYTYTHTQSTQIFMDLNLLWLSESMFACLIAAVTQMGYIQLSVWLPSLIDMLLQGWLWQSRNSTVAGKTSFSSWYQFSQSVQLLSCVRLFATP